MKRENLIELFNTFLSSYDYEKKDKIWMEQSFIFKEFWQKKIIVKNNRELNDQEVDEIVQYLDRNAKGNTKETEAVAKAMIPQGAWRRMFNQFHANNELSGVMTKIFEEKDLVKRAGYIDKLYKINEGNKNSLTGKSAAGVNDFLVLNDPINNLSIISLKDRKRLIDFLKIPDFQYNEKATIGTLCVDTNKALYDYFNSINLNYSARTISVFCYSRQMQPLWKTEKGFPPPPEEPSEAGEETESVDDKMLFYMESQLEDFLIENWDKTELGKKYELIEEDGDLISQQYQTTIGKIDILAKEKQTGRFVVIELKKNQSSDDTIGQITRYMGWIEAHLTKGKPSKGIIIAGKYDDKLSYAIKKVQDIEVYVYKVNFSLEPFKERE